MWIVRTPRRLRSLRGMTQTSRRLSIARPALLQPVAPCSTSTTIRLRLCLRRRFIETLRTSCQLLRRRSDMTMNGVQIFSSKGETLTLMLADISQGYTIRSIDGLDPVKANVVSSSFANQDGEQYQS